MQKTINHLIQLQELSIAKAQQEASMSGGRLTQLDESMETMMAELSGTTANNFKKLQARGLLSIVPISNQGCSACGMSLPVSFVQQVRQAETIYQCPNCAVMLYYSDALPRGTARKQRRNAPTKVGIERFSAPELMITKLEAKTSEDVISELCNKMAEEGFVEKPDILVEEAMKREAIVSTAVENGLAFPHVRGIEGGGLTLVVGISKKGIKFGAPSGKLTRLFFFMVIPTAASAFYLKLLSGLSQVFQDKDARDKLMAAEKPAEVWKVLNRLTKSKIS